jgi:hypothetical protein
MKILQLLQKNLVWSIPVFKVFKDEKVVTEFVNKQSKTDVKAKIYKNKINLNKKCQISRLRNFPISFLAICLGLIGFTLAWQKAEIILKLPISISYYLLCFTIVIMVLVLSIYLLKIFKYPKEVSKEFNHPIKLNFYPILAKLFYYI